MTAAAIEGDHRRRDRREMSAERAADQSKQADDGATAHPARIPDAEDRKQFYTEALQ